MEQRLIDEVGKLAGNIINKRHIEATTALAAQAETAILKIESSLESMENQYISLIEMAQDANIQASHIPALRQQLQQKF